MEHSAHSMATAGAPAPAAEDADRLLEASALLSQAVQESDPAVRQIGDAIERMMRALHGSGVADADLRRALAKDLALCVHGLQFHDRLTQQVNYARDLITRPETCTLTARTRFQCVDSDESSIELF